MNRSKGRPETEHALPKSLAQSEGNLQELSKSNRRKSAPKHMDSPLKSDLVKTPNKNSPKFLSMKRPSMTKLKWDPKISSSNESKLENQLVSEFKEEILSLKDIDSIEPSNPKNEKDIKQPRKFESDRNESDSESSSEKGLKAKTLSVKFPNGDKGSIIWVGETVLKDVVRRMCVSRGLDFGEVSVEDKTGNPVELEKTLSELNIYEAFVKVLSLQSQPSNIEDELEHIEDLEYMKKKRISKGKIKEKLLNNSEEKKANALPTLSKKTTKAKFSLEVVNVAEENRSRVNFSESVLFNPTSGIPTSDSDVNSDIIKERIAAAERYKQLVPPKLDDPILQRSTVEKLKAKITNRQNVAFELLDKEQDYLRYLCLLLQSFKKPMLESHSKLSLTEEQIQVAYGNVEDIIPLHQELLDELLKKFESWSDTQTLGDIFLKWLLYVSEPYKVYAMNYHDCLIVWEDIKDKPGVKNFLETTYTKTTTSAGQLDIGAFLIKPIQRITRDYTMIFERLVKYTPPTHSDSPLLAEVMKRLKEITMEVNGATNDPSDLKYFRGPPEEVYSPRTVGGYIYKKGGHVRNWKYRFMKIELDTKELVYYKADNKKERKGSIPLSSIVDVKPAIYCDKGGTERKNLFIIVTGERTFFIQPHNQVQSIRWIESIDFYRKEENTELHVD